MLNELDDYLYTYHDLGQWIEKILTKADGFEYSQQNFSGVHDNATQLLDLPAYNEDTVDTG